MNFRIKNGFMIIDSGKPGPLFVAPHAAIAFYKPGDSQDQNTHYIAFELTKSGGKALVSLITREKDIGVDFFREEPDASISLKTHELLRSNLRRQTRVFRKKYAWAAKDMNDHSSKKSIYKDFWSELRNFKGPIIFIHRQFFNPIRHPSIIDIVPLNHVKKLRDTVKTLNKKYKDILKETFPLYIEAFSFKTDCILFKRRIERMSDLHLFRGTTPKIQKRIKRFEEKVKKYPFLEITYKRNFDGGQIKDLIERDFSHLKFPIIELEVSEFLTNRFPKLAVYIIEDMLKELKKSKLIQN